MQKTIIAATILAAALGTANAKSVTLGGGFAFDSISGHGTPGLLALDASTATSGGIGLHADALVGLRSADAAQTALTGSIYLPTVSGPRELDLAANGEQQFGRLSLEPGLDLGYASMYSQTDAHAAYSLRGGYSLGVHGGCDTTLTGGARVGIVSGGRLYAGEDVGVAFAGIEEGTLALSYANLRDGALPRQAIVSLTYRHALRF